MSHIFPRGFKAEAERQSLAIRQRFRLGIHQACPARCVAKLHGISVTPAGSLLPLLQAELRVSFPNQVACREQLAWLVDPANGEFSAVAVKIRGCRLILFNEHHSAVRQESDIMHELAHLLREHQGDALELNSDISLRSVNKAHEAEAEWLGAALQIPEAGLMYHARAGRTTSQIAEVYGASLQLATYRWNMVGVNRRLHFEQLRRQGTYQS